MAYTTINKSTEHFNTKLYTGNGSDNHAITGVGFQPDFVWLKSRSQVKNHFLQDVVRGITYQLRSSASNAENNYASYVKSIQSDGFTLGTDVDINNNGSNYVAWNWKAGGGQGSSNTDGSINTTYTSVNTTAGFSISSYTGTGSNATVGHGLGVAPSMVIVKNRSSAENWRVYHKGTDASAPQDYDLKLNLTNARDNDNTVWNDTAPTSSVFSVGTSAGTNASGSTYISYCFAEKQGYSKFGSFIGNQTTDGTFIYTGFAPAWVMFKESTGSASGDNWFMYDNKRSTFNQTQKYLKANKSDAETDNSGGAIDMLSNGFKIRTADTSLNDNGETYIYMAFGQSLVGSNNVPCTAR